MVVAVHPERLAREAASAASAAEAWDRMRPAERFVGTAACEPRLPFGRCDVVFAVAVRTARRNEHRVNLLLRGPSAGPARARRPTNGPVALESAHSANESATNASQCCPRTQTSTL